jgi:hypothetical protein
MNWLKPKGCLIIYEDLAKAIVFACLNPSAKADGNS